MATLSKLRTLSPREWRYTLLALLLPPAIRFAIYRRGYKTVHSWLRNNAPLPAASPMPLATPEITRLATLMNAAANRSPIRTNCLQRSLALWWLLRRVGISSQLRIGVDKLGGALKAHAWLEKDGVVLNDSLAGIERFFPFDQAFDPAMFDTP